MEWGIIFSIAIRALDWWLGHNKAKQDTYDAFVKFIEKVDKGRAAKLKQSYDEQLQRLKNSLPPSDAQG